MTSIRPASDVTSILLQRVRQGDQQALDDLLARHRPWIRGLVNLRLDRRLRQRVDPSDVVQEVQMEVSRRINDYLEREPMSFHLWLRQTTYENLVDLRRKHLQAECRSVQREVSLVEDSSVRLAQVLLGVNDPPDQRLIEKELHDRLQTALDELPETDREIVVMRIFEDLENQDISQVLGLHPTTVSKRFGRALFRLRAILVGPESEDPAS